MNPLYEASHPSFGRRLIDTKKQDSFGRTVDSSDETAPGVDPYAEERDVFEKSFAPFQNLDFFEQRYLATSRYLRKNPDLRDVILQAKTSDSDSDIEEAVELLNISRQIDTPESVGSIGEIMSMASLAKDILAIRSPEQPDNTGITMIELAFVKMADSVPDDKISEYWTAVAFVHDQLEDLAKEGVRKGEPGWVATRLNVLEHALLARMHETQWVKGLPGETDTELAQPEQIRSDSLEVKQLFEAAHSHQRYGVKLSYVATEVREGSLIFVPRDIYEKELDRLMPEDVINDSYERHNDRASEALCDIIDTSQTSFKKLYMNFVHNGQTGEPVLVSNALTKDTRGSISVSKAGALVSTYAGNYGEELAYVAARQHKYGAFRRFQAEVLARYLDLTNSLEIAEKVRLETATAGTGTSQQARGYQEPMDIVRELLVPRIRVAENNDTPQNKDTVTESAQRSVRIHGVVWHIRRLPFGWHASPEAEAMAQKAGVKLNDGETFVQSHERGSNALGRVTAHKLVTLAR